MSVVVPVLITTVVIGATADWRAFVALPPLLEALRRLVEAVNGHAGSAGSASHGD